MKNVDAEMTFKSRLKIRDYAEGYRLFDLKRGKSAGREWKSTIFFMISMLMLFLLLMSKFNLAKMPVCAIIMLISAYMCTYYVYILPRKAKLMGEHIYKNSKLLSKKYEFEVYGDYFIMKNQYESLKRYYSEITDCMETNDIFVLVGGIEKRLIVIAKRELTENQKEKISKLFHQHMIKQYRRIK